MMCLFALTMIGHAQALYEQCPALTSAPSAEAAVKPQLAALKDKDPKTRLQAAQQLSKSCDQRAVQPLVDLLKDPEPEVRASAVEALGRLGDRSAVQPLVDAANFDRDWHVQLALGPALCSFQVFEAGYAALNSVANPQGNKIVDENDMRARCAAILAVNQLRDVRFSRKALGFLFLFLEEDREPLRQIAEQTMYKFKDTRNGPHELIGTIKQNNNPAFRQKAAYWLGKLGIEMGRSILEEAAANDRDPRVQQAAKEALALLNKTASH